MSELYPWQHELWQRLNQALAANRLPHALLISGETGVGKQALARLFAQRLFCLQPENNLPCGHCAACKTYLAGTYADFLWIEPEDVGKPIKVDQIRDMGHFSHLSRQADWKVIVIHGAESMNVQAANSLLKTLEEPPAGTILLLLTAKPRALKATILSRCQQFKIDKPDQAQAKQWLLTTNIPSYDIDKLLQLSQGNPLQALEMQSNETLAHFQSSLKNLLDFLANAKGLEQATEAWDKVSALALLDWQLRWVNDALKVQQGLMRKEELLLPEIAQLIPFYKAASLLSLYRALLERKQLNVQQLNARLLVEDQLLLWVNARV